MAKHWPCGKPALLEELSTFRRGNSPSAGTLAVGVNPLAATTRAGVGRTQGTAIPGKMIGRIIVLALAPSSPARDRLPKTGELGSRSQYW